MSPFQSLVGFCQLVFVGVLLSGVGIALFVPYRARVWALVLFCVANVIGSVIALRIFEWAIGP